MDAISFVLGVKSAQLRSSQLKDLVYRGRRLAQDNEDAGGEAAAEDDNEEDEGEGTAKKAWVLAVYEDTNGKEYQFQRTYARSYHLATPHITLFADWAIRYKQDLRHRY